MNCYLMKSIPDMIEDAKNALPNITPTPAGLKAQSSAHDLKSRLEWGEPALTILDVRDREAFNKNHIMGAMFIPLDQLGEQAQSTIDAIRDIYVYANSDQETTQAADRLREIGFKNVAELKGGLAAWRAIAGPTEGVEEDAKPGPEAYNVVSRVTHHMKTQNNTL
jgi:rhodanese-related sulfurtransferase